MSIDYAKVNQALELRRQTEKIVDLRSQIGRARSLLAAFLREHPEHDQADIRIWQAHNILERAGL